MPTPNLIPALEALKELLLIPLAAAQNTGIQLLEPIGGVTSIPTDNQNPLGALGYYIGLLYPWALGMGAATAVLMGVWGGIEIMQAGADQGKYDAGKNRLMMSLGGLLLVLLSATILNTINPSFFR